MKGRARTGSSEPASAFRDLDANRPGLLAQVGNHADATGKLMRLILVACSQIHVSGEALAADPMSPRRTGSLSICVAGRGV